MQWPAVTPGPGAAAPGGALGSTEWSARCPCNIEAHRRGAACQAPPSSRTAGFCAVWLLRFLAEPRPAESDPASAFLQTLFSYFNPLAEPPAASPHCCSSILGCVQKQPPAQAGVHAAPTTRHVLARRARVVAAKLSLNHPLPSAPASRTHVDAQPTRGRRSGSRQTCQQRQLTNTQSLKRRTPCRNSLFYL